MSGVPQGSVLELELELELELIGLVKPQALNVPLVASNPVVIPLLERTYRRSLDNLLRQPVPAVNHPLGEETRSEHRTTPWFEQFIFMPPCDSFPLSHYKIGSRIDCLTSRQNLENLDHISPDSSLLQSL